MGKWKNKGRRKIEESVKEIFLKKSECQKKKIIGKLEIKRKYIYIYIYIDVKTDKQEYVKLIIYLYIFL